MKLSAHRSVLGEFDKLRDSLVDGPANWMPGSFDSAAAAVMELQAEMPLGRLKRYAAIDVGTVHENANEVVVPVTWRSLEAERLFPEFRGLIRLQRSDDGHHRLELDGDYKPPGGVIGRLVDAAALRRVAHATAENFLGRVAAVLGRNALGRTVAQEVASGQITLDTDPPA